MGVVYRARDRLTGQIVALKRVSLNRHAAAIAQGSTAITQGSTAFVSTAERVRARVDDPTDAGGASTKEPLVSAPTAVFSGIAIHGPNDPSDAEAQRQALAQEFRALASLHHPNIISVLDYGFDDQQQPYITMELLEDAKNLRDFASGKPLLVRLELLRQILTALTYLHRREIIHRDVKPSNVLVIPVPESPGFRVKLLDFGLAVTWRRVSISADTVAGTLGYLAPELLQGQIPSVSSDLYSVGVLAYELLVGKHPFPVDGPTERFLYHVKHNAPDFTGLKPAALIPIITQSLAKTPWDRPESAATFLQELVEKGGLLSEGESEAVRDSFLIAAPFTGRENEFCALATELAQSQRGMGAAWLLGGHSGIGKSRLLDEVRAMALIRGFCVARGETAPHGQSPLLLWKTPLRMLCLGISLSDEELSALECLIPDVSALQGNISPSGPKVVAQLEIPQLAKVLIDILKRQPQPVLLLLEDLQWADEESLTILRTVASHAVSLPMLIIATYRSEEAPTLPEKLPELSVMQLERLSERSLQQLCTSMMGEQASSSLQSLIERETAGNTYFLVELMRSLAEEAGSLDRVAGHDLLKDIQRGGIMEVLRRRIDRVPQRAMPLLRIAAVAGRQLDLAVIEQLLPHAEELIEACASVGVLELHDQHWRFSHDKLREFVLAALPADSKRELHSWLAETITQVYPDLSSQAMRVAHHHLEAGQLAQAGDCFSLAGSVAISAGSVNEGEQLLSRAIALQTQTGRPPILRLRTYRQLAMVRFTLGKNQGADTAIQHAFALAGIRWPHGVGARTIDTVARFVEQTLRQSRHLKATVQHAEEKELYSELLKILPATEVYLALAQPASAMFCWVHCLRIAETVDDVMAHLQAASFVAYAFSSVGLHTLSAQYLARSESLSQRSQQAEAMILIERAKAGIALAAGRFGDAISACQHARQQNTTALELTPTFRILRVELLAHLLSGNLSSAWSLADELWALSERHDLPQKQTLAVGYRGALWARQGDPVRAARFLEQASGADTALEDSHHALWFGGQLASCYAKHGQPHRALRLAKTQVQSLRSHSVASILSALGMYALIETYFALGMESACSVSEASAEVSTIMKQLGQLALRYRPVSPIFELGLFHMLQLKGQVVLSIWALRRALVHASALCMPYEEALAHTFLAEQAEKASPAVLLLIPESPQTHRARAQERFEQLGIPIPRQSPT